MVAANRFAGRRFGKVRPPSSGPAEPNAREWCHRPSAFIVLSLLAFRPFACSPFSSSCSCALLFTFVLLSCRLLYVLRCVRSASVRVCECVRTSANYDYYFLCFKTGFQLGLSSCWLELCATLRGIYCELL